MPLNSRKTDRCINYEWAPVGADRSDKYLWILSRTENLPQDVVNTILSEARE